ncbi:MAG: hypothetical protein US69_C0013G0031 [candidate division TM6 bacterium GW2011_GWF2_38_10]|nr:MAG: hypothetical protein US69_C0013G0031 [candidate division TM6 bacterium GW2011_GWF2_38_10]
MMQIKWGGGFAFLMSFVGCLLGAQQVVLQHFSHERSAVAEQNAAQELRTMALVHTSMWCAAGVGAAAGVWWVINKYKQHAAGRDDVQSAKKSDNVDSVHHDMESFFQQQRKEQQYKKTISGVIEKSFKKALYVALGGFFLTTFGSGREWTLNMINKMKAFFSADSRLDFYCLLLDVIAQSTGHTMELYNIACNEAQQALQGDSCALFLAQELQRQHESFIVTLEDALGFLSALARKKHADDRGFLKNFHEQKKLVIASCETYTGNMQDYFDHPCAEDFERIRATQDAYFAQVAHCITTLGKNILA